MKIKVGDKVEVITGANKGKSGKVITVLKNKDRVIVEKVNIVKKHVKPNGQKETGGILEVEAPIHVSNVKKIEDKKEEKKDTKKVVKKEETKTAKKTTKSSKE